MKNRVNFAMLLVEYRGRCGWSQSELAEKIGVHRNTVASWESGPANIGIIPSKGVVLRLAEALLLSQKECAKLLNGAGFSSKHRPADYWNIPYRRNPYFVGREMVLQSLRQRLVPGTRTTALTQSISGLVGIGKTQLAVEYAYHYGEHYAAVLWIQANSPEVAMAAYLQLATEVLELPEQHMGEEQIAEVKRWLQKHHGWLLIFDDVEDPQAILSTFVPSEHQGSVLITTRRRDVGSWVQSEMVPVFSEEDAILFLLRRTGRIARQASVTEATTDTIFLARTLCQLLGPLPLALNQAGAYIAETGVTLQRYIDLYKQYRLKLLDRRGSGDHHSLYVTFKLSWDVIQRRNVLAGKALQFCAFLAPEQIPEALVPVGIRRSETAEGADPLEMDEALGLLYRYSLIERRAQKLSQHRFVQEAIQAELSEEEQQQWMKHAILAVNAVFPNGEHDTWPLCEFLLPHALTCAKWVSVLRQQKPEGARLLGVTGRYFYERAQYEEAELFYQQALHIFEEQLGASPLAMAINLNNLAELYERQDRYEEAEPLYQQALHIFEEQLGVPPPDMAISLNSLAELYERQGRYEEAEPLYQRGLHIFEEQLGASHPATVMGLNSLARLYERQGRYEEAESLLKRARHIFEEQLGASHPATATSLNSLARLYESQGRYEEAEPLLKRALLIFEEQLGASHPDTAISLNNLAGLYERQGRYTEAEPLYQQAIWHSEASLGIKHPQTQQIMTNYRALLSHMHTSGDLDALRQLLTQKERPETTDGN